MSNTTKSERPVMTTSAMGGEKANGRGTPCKRYAVPHKVMTVGEIF